MPVSRGLAKVTLFSTLVVEPLDLSADLRGAIACAFPFLVLEHAEVIAETLGACGEGDGLGEEGEEVRDRG